MVSSLDNLRAAPNAAESCEFIARLDPARSVWIVGAAIDDRWTWISFHGVARRRDAEQWIAARYATRAECWLLLGDTHAAVGPALSEGDVRGSRFIAARSSSPAAFLTAPWPPLTIWRDRAGQTFAAWKLPAMSADPCRDAGVLASLCCTAQATALPQLHFIPLPGDMRVGRLGSIIRMPNHGRAAPLPTPQFLTNPRPGGNIINVGYSPVEALPDRSGQNFTVEEQFLARRLEEALETRDIKGGRVVGVKSGPIVTVCEYEPPRTAKVDPIVALADDVAMLLKVKSVIARPVTERGVIAFDIANAARQIVHLRDLLSHGGWFEAMEAMALPICIGVNVSGDPLFFDLATAPHLLVAGMTGSGKSVALNGMLVSMLTARGPEHLRLVLIDPKRVELAPYAGVAHLLTPIESAPEHAATALQWLVAEMDRRYDAFAAEGVQEIAQFNAGSDDALPRIVLVIDEYASLIARAKDAKPALDRIFAEGRASGIHAVLATQHPSAKTIDSSIKTNIPIRLIFAMRQKEGSQAALGDSVATKLLGKGDGLFLSNGSLERVLSPFVSAAEIAQAVAEARKLGAPEYAIEPRKQTESLESGDLPVENGKIKAEPRDVIKGIIIKALVSGETPTPALQDAVKSSGYKSNETFEKALKELKAAGVATSRKDDSGGRALIWSLVK